MAKKKKKRIAKMVDAVSDLFREDLPKAKELKKEQALLRFIEKLEERKRELEKQISDELERGRAAELQIDQVHRLEKQIKKAKKLLA